MFNPIKSDSPAPATPHAEISAPPTPSDQIKRYIRNIQCVIPGKCLVDPSSRVVLVPICQRASPSARTHFNRAPKTANHNIDRPILDPAKLANIRSPAPTPVAATKIPGAIAENHDLLLSINIHRRLNRIIRFHLVTDIYFKDVCSIIN